MEADNEITAKMEETVQRDEEDRIHDGIVAIAELTKKLKTNAPLADLRGECERIFDDLAGLGSRHREVMLLARIQSGKVLLNRAPETAETRSALTGELARIDEMLLGLVDGSQEATPTPPSLLEPEPLKTTIEPIEATRSPAPRVARGGSFVETYLAGLSFIGEGQLEALRKHRLLDDDRFVNADPVTLAALIEVSTNAAFELKGQIHKALKQEREREIVAKVREVERINTQLSDECEAITADNQAMMESVKSSQARYAEATRECDAVFEAFHKKQNEAAASHTECNRLSIELKFLRNENRGLVDEMERTHERLDGKLKLFTAIRNNCDFIKGECSVSEELMEVLGGLLNDVASQCESLGEKVISTEDRLDSIFYELNEITKEGKTLFYSKL